MKVKTMNLQGREYAKVADRLKQFREDFPKSKIETEHRTLSDGSIEFKAWIWKDKTDYIEVLKATGDPKVARGSADSDGDARNKIDKSKDKDFEKLQTIAVGRALAMIGYIASGEIASFEEMEEFNSFKESKVDEAITKLNDCKDLIKLKEVFISLGSLMSNQRVIEAKDKKKEEITKCESSKSTKTPKNGSSLEKAKSLAQS